MEYSCHGKMRSRKKYAANSWLWLKNDKTIDP
jgi:hypothetical protein